MASSGILLTQTPIGWRISGLNSRSKAIATATATNENLIEVVQQFARSERSQSKNIVIAVASTNVLFAKLTPSQAKNISSNASLRFALESILPVDAESIVADSSTAGQTAIAMEFALVKPLVFALEAAGFSVQHIAPESMMFCEQLMEKNTFKRPACCVWFNLEEPNRIEFVSVDRSDAIANWQITDAGADSVRRCFILNDLDLSDAVHIGGKDQLQRLNSLLGKPKNAIEIDHDEAVIDRAASYLSRRKEPWYELRRDVLASSDPWRPYRSSIKRLCGSIAILACVVCGTLFWKAYQYQSNAARQVARQESLFRQTFPKQRLPAAIVTRLKSENAKAIGTRQIDNSAIVPQSALKGLQSIVECLAVDLSANADGAVAFEVKDIRIENERIAIDMELSSQDDSAKVAATLARKGFEIEPPSTSLLDTDRVLASFVGSMPAIETAPTK